jgi:hypothetical protein
MTKSFDEDAAPSNKVEKVSIMHIDFELAITSWCIAYTAI